MRHRFIFSLSVLVAATFVVTSCTEQSTTAPTAGAVSTLADGDGPLLSAHAGNPVVFRATGGGGLSTPLFGSEAPEGGWRTFSFNALLLEDNTAKGQMQYNQRSESPFNVRQHGTVTCVNDIGSGVILIAAHGTRRVADADPAPFPPLPPAVLPDNDGMLFAVRDNDEGDASDPDQITAVIHTLKPFADAVCAKPSDFGFTVDLAETFFNDVEAGNIQVTSP